MHWSEFWANIATMVTAATALGALGYAVWQIYTIRNEGKVSRTYEFMKRFNELDFLQSQNTAIYFLRDQALSEAEKWNMFAGRDQNSISLRCCVENVLTFFEEMGALYNKDFIIKDMIKDWFGPISLECYEYAEWLIRRINQKHGKPGKPYYKEWKMMNEDFEKPQEEHPLPFLRT